MPCHSLILCLINTQVKKGAPIKPVKMPRGSSPPVRVRARVSMMIKNPALSRVVSGKRSTLLLPTIIRPRCGMTSPIQPIVPLMHTADAVSTVEQMMATPRSKRRLTPKERASLSPKDKILILYKAIPALYHNAFSRQSVFY